MNKPTEILTPSSVLPFGKYKGKTCDEIFHEDPSYLMWLDANTHLQLDEEYWYSVEDQARLENFEELVRLCPNKYADLFW